MKNEIEDTLCMKDDEEYRYERSAPKKNKKEADFQRNMDRSPCRNIGSDKVSYGDGKVQHEPTWEYLYSFGVQKRRALEERMQNNKNKLDKECTFEPMIRKTSRYLIPDQSSFLERNRIWNENRIEKLVKEKEE